MADQTTNTALKTTDHSRFGVGGILTTPYYDQTNGWAVLSKNHLCVPFTDNWFKPSTRYVVSFAHKLAAFVNDAAIDTGVSTTTLNSASAVFSAGDVGRAVTIEGAGAAGADLVTTIATYTSPTVVEITDAASTTVSGATATFGVDDWDYDTQPSLEAGLWDNSAGQRKWMEGTAVELTAVTQGTPATPTSRDYKVVVKTDWGDTLESEAVTVADTPADGEFDTDTYVLLTATRITGAVEYAFYRETAGTFELLREVYPQRQWKDRDSTLKTVVGYPTADFRHARAHRLATSRFFLPAEQWARTSFAIDVAASYDKSKTTDKQWFRIGLTGQLIGAGLKLYLDQISVDAKRGFFTPSPVDFLAKRSASSAPTSGDQGNVNTGGGGIVLPPWGTIGRDGIPDF